MGDAEQTKPDEIDGSVVENWTLDKLAAEFGTSARWWKMRLNEVIAAGALRRRGNALFGTRDALGAWLIAGPGN